MSCRWNRAKRGTMERPEQVRQHLPGLTTFLSKQKGADGIMMPNPDGTQSRESKWAYRSSCPICGADATRTSLRVDALGVTYGTYLCSSDHIWITHWFGGAA